MAVHPAPLTWEKVFGDQKEKGVPLTTPTHTSAHMFISPIKIFTEWFKNDGKNNSYLKRLQKMGTE